MQPCRKPRIYLLRPKWCKKPRLEAKSNPPSVRPVPGANNILVVDADPAVGLDDMATSFRHLPFQPFADERSLSDVIAPDQTNPQKSFFPFARSPAWIRTAIFSSSSQVRVASCSRTGEQVRPINQNLHIRVIGHCHKFPLNHVAFDEVAILRGNLRGKVRLQVDEVFTHCSGPDRVNAINVRGRGTAAEQIHGKIEFRCVVFWR